MTSLINNFLPCSGKVETLIWSRALSFGNKRNLEKKVIFYHADKTKSKQKKIRKILRHNRSNKLDRNENKKWNWRKKCKRWRFSASMGLKKKSFGAPIFAVAFIYFQQRKLHLLLFQVLMVFRVIAKVYHPNTNFCLDCQK